MIAGGPGVPDRGWRQDTLARHGESTRVGTRREPEIGHTWLYGCQVCAADRTVCRGVIQGMREARHMTGPDVVLVDRSREPASNARLVQVGRALQTQVDRDLSTVCGARARVVIASGT